MRYVLIYNDREDREGLAYDEDVIVTINEVDNLSYYWLLDEHPDRMYALMQGELMEVRVIEEEQFDDETSDGEEVLVSIYSVWSATEPVDDFTVVAPKRRAPQEP